MPGRLLRTIGFVLIASMAIGPPAHAETNIDFNRDIRPLLSENCFACHGPDAANQAAGLRLDLRVDATRELDSGASAIVPSDPANSEMMARLTSDDESLRMPPLETGKVLTEAQIALLREWIASGAGYAEHWAFIAPQRPSLPQTENQSWSRTPIDRFILAELEQQKLAPEPEADKATLIRRATLDLTGLPPTRQEVAAFLADTSPDAYERLLERLFASPHYGEQMAVRWLDHARYADSNGFQSDGSRDIWAWRDWVIHAFNQNLPFDQFTIEQLAGDMLPNPTRDQVVATGFNRNLRLNGEAGRIVEEWFVETVIDRVETTGLTWLGLTFNCCRCHDHKYDPITQKEFYQFYSFFNSVEESGVLSPNGKNGENTPPVLYLTTPEQELVTEQYEQALAIANQELKDAKARRETPLDAAEEKVNQAKTKLQDHLDSLTWTMVMKESTPRDAFVLARGEYDKPGEKVSRGLPAILPPLPEGEPMDRLGLARWIVHPTNPLTARVWVNRQWEHFFGTGIVKTTENFGSQAEYPSHPELLDWLACEFQQPTDSYPVGDAPAQSWDMKAIQKLIMMSAVYRQRSHVSAEKLERDPENRLLARGARFRLTGEAIRDQSLAVSGLLVPKLGGPSVRPYMPEGVWDETSMYGNLRNYQHESGEGLYRRTLYTIWKRTAAPPSMLLFDAPNREVCTIKRSRTNTPLQALSLLNEITFVEAARGLAKRMICEGGDTPTSRLAYGFQLVTARKPSPRELEVLGEGLRHDLAHFQQQPDAAAALIRFGEMPHDETIAAAELAAYTLAANVLMNLDEFVTRE